MTSAGFILSVPCIPGDSLPSTCSSVFPGVFSSFASSSTPPYHLVFLGELSDPSSCFDPLEDDPEAFLADPDFALASSSAKLDYCRMLAYIVSLFPQAASVAAAPVPPRALFEDFFASDSSQASLLPKLNWFDCVRTSLLNADAHHVSFVVSGKQVSHLISPVIPFMWFVIIMHSRPFPRVNESVLFPLGHSPGLNRLVGISLHEAQLLEVSFRSQLESSLPPCGYCRPFLGTLRCRVSCLLTHPHFNQLVTLVSKGLAQPLSSYSPSSIRGWRWLQR